MIIVMTIMVIFRIRMRMREDADHEWIAKKDKKKTSIHSSLRRFLNWLCIWLR